MRESGGGYEGQGSRRHRSDMSRDVDRSRGGGTGWRGGGHGTGDRRRGDGGFERGGGGGGGQWGRGSGGRPGGGAMGPGNMPMMEMEDYVEYCREYARTMNVPFDEGMVRTYYKQMKGYMNDGGGRGGSRGRS